MPNCWRCSAEPERRAARRLGGSRHRRVHPHQAGRRASGERPAGRLDPAQQRCRSLPTSARHDPTRTSAQEKPREQTASRNPRFHTSAIRIRGSCIRLDVERRVPSGCQVRASAILRPAGSFRFWCVPTMCPALRSLDASEAARLFDPTMRTRTRSSLTPAALPRPHRVRHAPVCHDAIRGSCRDSTS
jgi:hypothetical protein